MNRALNFGLRITLVAILSAGCLSLSDNGTPKQSGSLLSEAHARVGRPLTPMSYAGVARRTTRRASATGAAVGAAAAYAPGCYQNGRCLWSNLLALSVGAFARAS